MTANLRFGNADPATVVRLVREHGVDVLSLQELTPDALRRLDAAGAAGLLPGRSVRLDVSWSGLGLMAPAPLRGVPPRPGRPETRLEALLSPDDGAALRLVPRVLLGDFNATLDHHEMRRLLGRGYLDAADATGDGLKPTWPTTGGRPPITIDHVLFPRPIKVARVTLHTVPGSDHRAVIAELVLPRSP